MIVSARSSYKIIIHGLIHKWSKRIASDEHIGSHLQHKIFKVINWTVYKDIDRR